MKRVLAPLLALALACGYAWLLLPATHGTFQSPDANGYFVQAALLVDHGSTELVPSSPLDYIGMHFLETADGRFFSRYSPGLGVLMAGPYALWGPEAALKLQPLMAAATILLLFLLVRRYAGDGLALLAALLWALHPLAAVHALNWGAHTALTFFLVAGCWVLEAWAREPRWWKALLAGLLLGAIPTIRYAEVVAGLGVAAFMVAHVVRRRDRLPDLFVALAGALVPVGLLLWRNYSIYGDPLDTGYALTGEQQAGTGFAWAFFDAKWLQYVEALSTSGLGLFLALGLAGLAGMCVRRDTRPTALLVGLVVLPITAVYAAYYWGAQGGGQGLMGLRFLLPTLPLWLVPAFWFFATAGRDRAVGVGLGLLFVAQCGLLYAEGRPQVERTIASLERTRQAYDFVAEEVPDGSALIVDRRLAETLQFYPRWRLLDASVVGAGAGAGRRGPGGFQPGGFGPGRAGGPPGGATNGQPGETPDRASPMQQGKASRLREDLLVRDAGERARRVTGLLYDVVEKGQALYWIGRPEEVEAFADNLFPGDRFTEVAKVELAGDAGDAARGAGQPARRQGARGQRQGPMGMPGPGGGPRQGRGADPFGLQPGQVLVLYRFEFADEGAEPTRHKGTVDAAAGKGTAEPAAGEDTAEPAAGKGR
ncbi:MAG: glycosyltransferase family 39 protein [Planctomycetota bacterium]